MISPELLEILRCPLDPSRTRLLLKDNEFLCERCRLRFKIKDGFPVLVVAEAESAWLVGSLWSGDPFPAGDFARDQTGAGEYPLSESVSAFLGCRHGNYLCH